MYAQVMVLVLHPMNVARLPLLASHPCTPAGTQATATGTAMNLGLWFCRLPLLYLRSAFAWKGRGKAWYHTSFPTFLQAYSPEALRVLEALPLLLERLQLGPGPTTVIINGVGVAGPAAAHRTSLLLPLLRSAALQLRGTTRC